VVGARGTGGCSGGLIFIDVSDPSDMKRDGCFSADGYTHDAVCFTYRGPDTEHAGKRICIASNEDSQTIIDVSDTQNPIQISRTEYPLSNYTHQGWITDDHKYLLFDDELDERNLGENTRTFVMDMSDLDMPSIENPYQATFKAIDHNIYIQGQYAYQANYRAGFRMLDIRNVSTANLSEVAYFDTYPANDNASFNSAWSVYPYFESGNVLISDIEKGLFIVKPRIPHFYISSPPQASFALPGENVVFDIDLTSLEGYSDNVELSVEHSIPGVSIDFASSSIPPNGTTTLTVSNTGSLDGAYHILLMGRGPMDNVVHDYSLSFQVNPVVFVNQASVGGDGRTWASAYNSLSAALDAIPESGAEIWLAQGTYFPTSSLDRSATFSIQDNVTLLGGFLGSEGSSLQRNPSANPTILSGNIGDLGSETDNSYHVITTSGFRSECTIDGLQIQDGNANAIGNSTGGGLLSGNFKTVVRNCTFRNNFAASGSAIYNSASKLEMEANEIIGTHPEMITSEASLISIEGVVKLKKD